MVEIRAGTGGDEAAIWARDLLNVYTKYASSQGWKTELMEARIHEFARMRMRVREHAAACVCASLSLSLSRARHCDDKPVMLECNTRAHSKILRLSI